MNLSNKQKAIIGLLGVIVSIYIFSFNYINIKKDKAFETISYLLLVNNEVSVNPKVEEIVVAVEEIKEEVVTISSPVVTDTDNYVGMLEIPKIGLKKGFFDISSPLNNVDKNIMVINPSNYPDVENGNLIIAGHSGSTSLAYFNELYQLYIDNQAYVYYKNIKYTYNIVNIYQQPKIGKIGIYRDINKTTLTLVTCTNNDATTQTVYIAELVNKTSY